MTVRPRNIQTSLRSTARSRSNSAPNALRDDARERTGPSVGGGATHGAPFR